MWGLERSLYIQSLSNDKKTIAFDHNKRSTDRTGASNEYEQPEQISERKEQPHRKRKQSDIGRGLYHFFICIKVVHNSMHSEERKEKI